MENRKGDLTSAVVDNILRLALTGSVIAAGLLLPNLLIALDKPLRASLNHLDKNAQEQELRRILSYMKSRQFLAGNYDHGLQITKKGRQRLAKLDYDRLRIEAPKNWDRQWRLVFFDIPEVNKKGRDALTAKLRQLNFYQLQRSVWIHPFPCREVIEVVSSTNYVDRFVSYVEVAEIDNQPALIKKFARLLP